MAGSCENPSRTRYVGGCRCAACREANRLYAEDLMRRKLYGRPLERVDAEPVRRHVEKLGKMGISRKEICRLTGVGWSSMQALMHGHHRTGEPVKRMSRENAERIMAVDGSRRTIGSKQMVNSRIVDDIPRLKAAGLPVRAMARMSGIGMSTLYMLAEGRHRAVMAPTHAKWMAALPKMEEAVGIREAKESVAFIKRDW